MDVQHFIMLSLWAMPMLPTYSSIWAPIQIDRIVKDEHQPIVVVQKDNSKLWAK